MTACGTIHQERNLLDSRRAHTVESILDRTVMGSLVGPNVRLALCPITQSIANCVREALRLHLVAAEKDPIITYDCYNQRIVGEGN